MPGIGGWKSVKSCMELIQPGMHIEPANGHPELPRVEQRPDMAPVQELKTEVLVIGGGPAGLSAAIESWANAAFRSSWWTINTGWAANLSFKRTAFRIDRSGLCRHTRN